MLLLDLDIYFISSVHITSIINIRKKGSCIMKNKEKSIEKDKGDHLILTKLHNQKPQKSLKTST